MTPHTRKRVESVADFLLRMSWMGVAVMCAVFVGVLVAAMITGALDAYL